MSDESDAVEKAVGGINPIEIVDDPDKGKVKCPACLYRTYTTYTASDDDRGVCSDCLVDLHQGESLMLNMDTVRQLVNDEKLSTAEEKVAFVDALAEQIEA